jgi:hypothetical protein
VGIVPVSSATLGDRTRRGPLVSLAGLKKVEEPEDAAEKLFFSVILSEAKNLSSIYAQSTERFFGEKHASE